MGLDINNWEPAIQLWGWQIVERTFVLPADQVCSLDRSEFFEAALFLKDLSNRFQLADAIRPLPFRSAETVLEFSRQSLEIQIVFCEIVYGIVFVGLDFDVVEIRVDRGTNIAGQRPRSCCPDQQKLIVAIFQREANKH